MARFPFPFIVLAMLAAAGCADVAKDIKSARVVDDYIAGRPSGKDPQKRPIGEFLCTAAAQGNVEAIRNLLERGADVNGRACPQNCDVARYSKYMAKCAGASPLYCAAYFDRGSAAVRLLLESGADPDVAHDFPETCKDAQIHWVWRRNATPLLIAGHNGNWDAAETLLAAGADTSITITIGKEEWPAAKLAGKDIARLIDATPPVAERRVSWQAHLDELGAALGADGDKAAAAGDNKRALELYVQALHDNAWHRGVLQPLRRRILLTALKVTPAPARPEEAERRMTQGRFILKEGSTQADFAKAAAEMQAAVDAAPAWADAYYNLGLVQQKAGQYDQAIANLKLYLIGAPEAPDAAAVKRKIYELEYQREHPSKALKEPTPSNTDSSSRPY